MNKYVKNFAYRLTTTITAMGSLTMFLVDLIFIVTCCCLDVSSGFYTDTQGRIIRCSIILTVNYDTRNVLCWFIVRVSMTELCIEDLRFIDVYVHSSHLALSLSPTHIRASDYISIIYIQFRNSLNSVRSLVKIAIKF